ncbi:MAG: hypothetical protein Q7J98_04110 [Kiritimatiellia bacterium]|nr:hypothetical protein [Kiritimatiellia bacterium]
MSRLMVVMLVVFTTSAGVVVAEDPKTEDSGTLVLVEFRKWVGEDANAHRGLAQEVKESLETTGVQLRQVLGDPGKPDNPRMFRQMILLDCKGKFPEGIVLGLPYVGAAIVFKDGVYDRGLPIAKPEVGEARGKPLPFAFRRWGSGELDRKKADMERYKKLSGVSVQFISPPPGSGGSAGCVKLTPQEGTTLLRVFLDTGADFGFHDPEK